MHPQKSVLPHNKILAWTPTQYYKIGDTVHILWQQNLLALYTLSCLLPHSQGHNDYRQPHEAKLFSVAGPYRYGELTLISWRIFIRAYTRFTHLCYFGCMTVTCIATRSDNCCYIFCYFATYIGFCIIPFTQYACYSAWRRRRRQLSSIGLGAVSCCS
jgi:hypothetical protein